MRKPVIAANWKMNNMTEEIISFFNEFKDVASQFSDRETMIAPSFPYLLMCAELAKGKNITIAAQDVYPADDGAFTGMVGSKDRKSVV